MKTAMYLVVVSVMVYFSLHPTQAVNSIECNCNCLHELTNGWTTCRNLSERIEEPSDVKNAQEQRRRHTLEWNDLEERLKLDSANIRKLNETMRSLMRRLDERGVNDVQGDSNGDTRLMGDGELDASNTFSVKIRRDIVETSNNLSLESINKTLLEEHLKKYLSEHLDEMRNTFLNASLGNLLHFKEETQITLNNLKENMKLKNAQLDVLKEKMTNIRMEIRNLRRRTENAGNPSLRIRRGQKGDTGLPGLPGIKGNQGLQGPKADQGLQGPKGDQGLQGLPGVPGMKGDRGLKGDKGDEGFQGIVDTFPGMKGDPGLPGPKGDPGIEGLPGLMGFPGKPGYPGMHGMKGEKGERGFTGVPGLPGMKGD